MKNSYQNLLQTDLQSALRDDGLLRTTRYAFGPNKLHYCGPDANREIFSYLKEEFCDLGLENLLKQFNTLYPYLKFIAASNKIRDPFHPKVVEAYWIGNDLLQNINLNKFYYHLIDDHGLKKKLPLKIFNHLVQKIACGAIPHHSFHVFNVWKRTGSTGEMHTLESMDSCRVSWGVVKNIDGPYITIESRPLILMAGKLSLGEPVLKKITRQLESDFIVDEIKIGDTITAHWNVPCEIISKNDAEMLEKYTKLSIDLANHHLEL